MFGDLVRAVDELVGLDVSMMCDSEVRETLIALRRDVDRLEAFAAVLVAVAHHRMIPSGDGAASTPAWLQWQTGQRIGDAKTSLAMGLACETLPLTAKAWRQGEISTGVARTICRGRRDEHEDVYAEIEETLVQYAARHDFRGLDAVVRHYLARADTLDDREPSELNDLHLARVGNRWNLQADLDHLTGKTVNTAIRAATDKPSESDTRTPVKRRADALTRICRFFLDHGDVPSEGGERPHVTIGVGWETLTEGRIPESWESPITDADIRRMLCDARISRIVFGPDRVPLDVGRATYTPSPSLRRAVIARDRGCRFPGCDRPPWWCEVHHIEPWEEGGETKLVNLVCLCSYHHHLVHTPGWSAQLDGNTFTVTTPENRLLRAA